MMHFLRISEKRHRDVPRRVRARWLSLVPAAVLLLVAAGCSKPDTSAPANAAPADNSTEVSAEATTGPHISLVSRTVSGTTLTASFKAWGGVVNVVISDGTKKLTEGKPVNGAVTLKVYNLSIGVHSTLSAKG